MFTLEIVRDLRRSRASASVREGRSVKMGPRWRASGLGGSLNHFGNDKEAVLGQRRIGEHERRNLAVPDNVLTHRQAHGNDRRHRLDASDVDLIEGLDEFENGVDLALQMRDLSLADGDAREMRDASDGGEIDGHPKLLKHLGTWAPIYS